MAYSWDTDGGSSKKSSSRSGGGYSWESGGTATEPKEDEGGKGFFDIGPIGAIRDAAGGATNVILDGLDILDMPRAAIVAGATEIGDGLDELFGDNKNLESGRLVDTGFSFDDFRKNFNNRVGVGDVIDANLDIDNQWAKRGLGFVGDVLTDPLTYATFGATTLGKTAGAGGGKAAGRLLFKEEVANTINQLDDDVVRSLGGRDAVQKVADDVLRDGTGRLAMHPRLSEAVDAKVGVNLFGKKIPNSERVADLNARIWGGTKRAITSRTWDKLPADLKGAWERVPGRARVIAATGSEADGLKWTNSSREATGTAREFGTNKATEFTQLYVKHADADWDEVRRIIEDPNIDAATVRSTEGAAATELSEWLEELRREYSKLSGEELPKLEDYFPRWLTKEAIDRLSSSGGRKARRAGKSGVTDPTMSRQLRRGEQFLGEELQTGSIDEIRDITRRVMQDPDGRIEIFLDDPKAIFDGYIKALSRKLRRERFVSNLERVGLAQYVDEVGIAAQKRQAKVAGKRLRKAEKGVQRAERKRQGALRKADELADTAVSEQAAAAAARSGQAAVKSRAALLDEELDGVDQLIQATNAALGQSKAPLAEVDESAALAARAALGDAESASVRAADELSAAQDLNVAGSTVPDVDDIERQLAQARQQIDATEAAGETVSPELTRLEARLTAQQAQLAAAETELKGASQDAADIRKSLRGETGKRTAARQENVDEFFDADPDALDDVDMLDPEYDRILAEAIQAQKKKARDLAKEDVAYLEDKIAKLGADGPATETVVRNATTKGEVPIGEVDRLERELAAAKRAKKGVGAAEKRLASARRGYKKTSKMVAKAREVEAQEWSGLNALKTADQSSADELIAANDELVGRLTRERAEATGRRGEIIEERQALAEEAGALQRAAKEHEARGETILAEIAEQEGLAKQHLAARHQAYVRWNSAADDVLTLQQEAQMAEVALGNLSEIAHRQGLWADPEIVQAIDDFMEMGMTRSKRGPFMKVYDVALSRWKAQALLSPGYHGRNFMTAVYMNHLAGMDAGRWHEWRHFRRIMRAEGDPDAVAAALAKIADPRLREAMATTYRMRGSLFGERGVEGIEEIYRTGATQRGLLGGKEGSLRRKADFTSLEFKPIELNFRAAGRVERMARGPLFIDGLMKGMDPEQALQRVVKHHFDYSDLSQMEERYLKRLLPFYTWTRNNVPVMTEYIARKPGGVMWYLHAKRNIEALSEEEDIVPGYFKESGSIRTPFDMSSLPKIPGFAETAGRFYAAPDLPFLNLNDTFNTSQLLSQVSPIVKAPIEISMGKKVFNDAPIRDDVIEAPDSWIWLMPALMVTSGFAGMPTVERDGGRFFMSEKDAYKIEQALPALGRARRLAPSEERYSERRFTSVLSTVFGFGSFTNGERQQSAELYLRNLEIQKQGRKASQLAEQLAQD